MHICFAMCGAQTRHMKTKVNMHMWPTGSTFEGCTHPPPAPQCSTQNTAVSSSHGSLAWCRNSAQRFTATIQTTTMTTMTMKVLSAWTSILSPSKQSWTAQPRHWGLRARHQASAPSSSNGVALCFAHHVCRSAVPSGILPLPRVVGQAVDCFRVSRTARPTPASSRSLRRATPCDMRTSCPRPSGLRCEHSRRDGRIWHV